MDRLFFYLINYIRLIGLKDVVDILLVGFAIYFILKSAKETRAMQLIKGVVTILLLLGISNWFHLEMINYILSSIIRVGVFVILVIFQPELRSFLDKLGRTGIGKFLDFAMFQEDYTTSQNTIKSIRYASEYMSSIKCGALIVVEGSTHLGESLESGTNMDSLVSEALLKNIFVPNTPLHDGAVIIRGDRIVSAGCILPLKKGHVTSTELGTRHRAALGLSETCDAVIIIVSEETGKISVANDGGLVRNLSGDALEKLLKKRLINDDSPKKISIRRKEDATND